MENSVQPEMCVKDLRMGNMAYTEESVLDLSKLTTISSETIHKSKKIKIADDQIVPATNEGETSNFGHDSSRLYSTSTTGSSLDMSPCSTYEDSLVSPVFLNPHNSFNSHKIHHPISNDATNENCEVLQKEKDSDSDSVMSNIKFYTLLEPLQEKIREASVRIQSLISSRTEADLETEHCCSLFTQFKTKFTPYTDAIKNAVEIIPKILENTSKNYIEIGDESRKFTICQASYEKAVSKYSVKDAAVALVECDIFLPKSEKLESTIGRTSSSTSTGKQLKPLETDMLTAIYKIIADKTKMVNIQRMESCQNASPDFLTLVEQKMVREALSQYFNQLRQREKRKKAKIDFDSQDDNQHHCGNINYCTSMNKIQTSSCSD